MLRKEIEQSQRESDEREQKRREIGTSNRVVDVLRSGARRSQLSKQAKKRKKEIGTSNRVAKKNGKRLMLNDLHLPTVTLYQMLKQ